MSGAALVAGASGELGRAICRELAAAGWEVRGLVRPGADPAALAELERLGVERLPGDLKDPVSLAAPLEGVELVVSSASATIPTHRRAGDTIATVDRQGNLALAAAAETAGTGRVIFVSSNSRDDGEATLAKRAVEERLARGSVGFTVLRPCRFMEIWFSPALGFDPRAGRAQLLGDGKAPVSWICREDVAAFVPLCAADAGAEGETIELGGPQPLSQRQVVAIFEAAGGIEFEVEQVDLAELRDERERAPDPLLASYAAFKLDTAAGSTVEMGATLARFGVELTSVEEFAARAYGAD